MSTEYSDRKTKEILTKVNGQAKLAEQAMRALMQRDPAFLISLVDPYISGILAHAIERARKQTGLKEPVPPKPMPKKPVAKPAAPVAKVSPNAMDAMMQAWAKGFEKPAVSPAKPLGEVSQKHLDAMQALIKKKPVKRD